jgi:hypothetical protein
MPHRAWRSSHRGLGHAARGPRARWGRLWLLTRKWLDLRRVGGTQGKQHTINRGRGSGDGEGGGVVEVSCSVFCLDGEEQHAADLAGIGANRPVRSDVGQGVLFGQDLDSEWSDKVADRWTHQGCTTLRR